MRGWLKGLVSFDEIRQHLTTCPQCRVPEHAARLSSMTHTYREDCFEYQEILRMVTERYKPLDSPNQA